MPLVVKCIPLKQLYRDQTSDYRIISFEPIGAYPDLEINKYGNFTISGNNLLNVQIGQECNFEIEPAYNSKYPASYTLVGYAGLTVNQQTIEVKPEIEFEILCRLMTKKQAKYVHKAYPNFVSLVLNGHEKELDHNKIYNVGEYRLREYIVKIKQDCKSILFYPAVFEYGITDRALIDKIVKKYDMPDEFKEDIANHPYHVFGAVLGLPFDKADAIIIEQELAPKDTYERCLYAVYHVLNLNETNGDTRLEADILAKYVEELVPEAFGYFKEIIEKEEAIHYNSELGLVSLTSTYLQEQNIAKHILWRFRQYQIDLQSKAYHFEGMTFGGPPVPMDWQSFTTVDEFECTDEQAKFLEYVALGYRVAMLTGSAGCVDCDTEFFNGYEWKRIADYKDGDKVLQYNQDGTAELVYPENYIKQPCEYLWHFETKYGVNQTVCDEHRIIYWSQKGIQRECNIQEIITKQNASGWNGKFKTIFKYSGPGIELSDVEIKIMCAVICDGSFFSQRPDSKYCRFHIKKERKKKQLRELFTEAQINWKEVKSAKEGYTDFYIQAPRREKEFTPYWYNCNHHQLQIICDNIMFWDGSENYTKNGKQRLRFSTTIKSTADFVQFAYSSCGYRASIHVNDRSGQKYFTCGKWYSRKSCEYCVAISERTMVGICADNRKNHNKTQINKVSATDGFKYCFVVPSHMLILRKNHNIFITGNCGKSSTLKAIISMLKAHDKSFLLCAPTGIAAKRISQLTGETARTVHLTMLTTNPASYDYIVIDETSILGVSLLHKLLERSGFGPRLIFIADEAQLASISCGNIVHDILKANIIPTVRLTKVFRYGIGGIATLTTDVRKGRYSDSGYSFPDCQIVKLNEDSGLNQIADQYQAYLDSGYTKDDILILSPYNIGKYGSFAINKAIQAKFNDKAETPIECKKPKCGSVNFRIGDKVLYTHNDYDMAYIGYDDNGDEIIEYKSVMNGDLGYIRECRETSDGANELLIEFDNGLARVFGSDLKHLLLGYSMSIHKTQGNQAKAVIVVLHESQANLLTRNLLYVAFSRAQEQMTIFANDEVIAGALEYQENLERDTWLYDILVGNEEVRLDDE